MQQWTIFARYPNSIANKPLGIYTSRNEAEGAACGYRRMMPKSIAIFVVWTLESDRFKPRLSVYKEVGK